MQKILTNIILTLWAILAVLTPILNIRWMDITFVSINWFIVFSWLLTGIITVVQKNKTRKKLED